MNDENSKLPDTLVAAYRREIWRVIEKFEHQLIEEMGDSTQLGIREIHHVADLLREDAGLVTEGIQSIIKHAPVKSRPVPRAFARHDQLGRLLVNRFAHLFGSEKHADPIYGTLSRAMLPAFFQAVKLMVGLEQLQQLQDMTLSIMDELKVVPTGDEDDDFWDAVYENTGAARLAMTVFVKVALRFKDFGRRKEWFIDFVNENLESSPIDESQKRIAERWGRDFSNVNDDEARLDQKWMFTETHFCELMSALFSDMQRWIIQADGLERIREEFGADAVSELLSIFTHLDADLARIRRERSIARAMKEAEVSSCG